MPAAVAPCDRRSTTEATLADVALRAVSKRFGTVEAVRELSLTVVQGEFIVLLGPTGAGKTTTLRLIAGLERPDRGDVLINGRTVTHTMPAERDVAFVFQQYSLYPHLSVYDNLAFPLRSPARRLDENVIRRRVGQVAALLHIDHKLDSRSTSLSGGEMQRVAIGRALVREPAVYLMDEPLSSLDAKLRAELRLELKRLQLELGATMLYVTHDQVEAMTMADRIGVIDEGRLLQLDTPRAIYERPLSTYVASRLGAPAINLIPAELWHGTGLPPRTRTVGARTEHIRILSPELARPAGRSRPVAEVHWVEHLGDQNHVHLDLAGHPLVTLADPDRPLKAGDRVLLELADPLYFDAAGIRIDAGAGAANG
jgi:multiple sugar transport system ATP-binding protein